MEPITETKLIEANMLIAKFMGYEIIPYNGSKSLIYNGNKTAKTVGEKKALWNGLELEFTGRFIERVQYPFDTDFNYLIPIIYKIECMGYVVSIAGISYKIYPLLNEKSPIVSLVCGDLTKKTRMTFELICAFIIEISKTSKES